MVFKSKIYQRLDFLKTNIIMDFQFYKNITWDDYSQNRRLRREVDRWVEEAVNCVLDISKIVLSEERIKIPDTNKEVLERISQIKGINSTLGSKIAS